MVRCHVILNKISNGIFRTGVDAGAGEDAVSAMVVEVGADAVDVDDAGREARSWVTLEFCICRGVMSSDKDKETLGLDRQTVVSFVGLFMFLCLSLADGFHWFQAGE